MSEQQMDQCVCENTQKIQEVPINLEPDVIVESLILKHDRDPSLPISMEPSDEVSHASSPASRGRGTSRSRKILDDSDDNMMHHERNSSKTPSTSVRKRSGARKSSRGALKTRSRSGRRRVASGKRATSRKSRSSSRAASRRR